MKKQELIKSIVSDEEVELYFKRNRFNSAREEFNHNFLIAVCERRTNNSTNPFHKKPYVELGLINDDLNLTEKGSKYLWQTVECIKLYVNEDYSKSSM